MTERLFIIGTGLCMVAVVVLAEIIVYVACQTIIETREEELDKKLKERQEETEEDDL